MMAVVYFVATFTFVEAVSNETEPDISSKGKKFLFSLPQLLHPKPCMILILYSGIKDTEFSFATFPQDQPTQTFTIHSNATFTLQHDIIENYESANGIRKSFVLLAANPIEIVAYLATALSSATFKPLPVSAWGKSYYAVNMKMNPSIQISSSENENRVTLKLNIEQPQQVNVVYLGKKYGHDDVMKIIVGRDQSFSIEDCSMKKDTNTGGLTGTQILASKPIGVVTGNCYILADNCKDKIGDLALDAPLPSEHYGTEFVMYPIGRGIEPYKEVWLMSNFNKTFVLFPDIWTRVFIQNTGTWKKVNISGSTYFNSTSPIQVVLVLYTRCPIAFGKNGGPSISSLVPNDWFFHTYTWRCPHIHVIIVIFSDENAVFTYWKNAKIDKGMPSFITEFTSKSTKWRVGVLEYFHENIDHRLQMTHSQKFGCYILYMGNYPSYISHLGFYISKPFLLLQSLHSDGMDIAEQPQGGKSDISKADETMGEWSEWQCTQTCSNTQQSRSRMCKETNTTKRTNRCSDEKPEVEFRQFNCYASVCPTDCPAKVWGEDCASTCDKCEDDCDKFTGSCFRCEPGFKSPKTSCKQECGVFEYGINCEGNCRLICSSDCIDRISGLCIPEHYYDTGIIVGVVSLVCFFAIVFFCLYVTGERSEGPEKESAVSTALTKSYTVKSSSEDFSDSDVES